MSIAAPTTFGRTIQLFLVDGVPNGLIIASIHGWTGSVLVATQSTFALAGAAGLPEKRLLDAAHIISDTDERFGQPSVKNGLPLSKIHHAAFDAHLIGIDPDYQLHVSDQLLAQNDGPMLEALKQLHGGTIHLPLRERDHPDRDRLAKRFERFKSVA